MPLSNSFLDGPLGAFLRSREVGRGEVCALTGMGSIKGRWNVKDSDYSEFLDLMNDYLFTHKRRPHNLVEQRRTDGLSPATIDMDFKYASESAIQRRFGIPNIRAFIRQYIKTIDEFYSINDVKQLRFFISLRPAPYEDKKNGKVIKDGVHIQCPDICLPTEHHQIIRQRMLDLGAVSNAFEGTDYINTDKAIYDEAVLKKAGWFFYGESKPDIPPYSLVAIYAYYPETGEFGDIDTSEFTSRDLLEMLSIRYNVRESGLVLNNTQVDEWNRLLAIVQPKGAVESNEEKGDAVDEEKAAVAFPTWLSTGHTEDEISLAKKLVEQCLSIERADSYSSWMEVGWCLQSIDGSEAMFDAWLNWSARSPKFSSNNIGSLRRDWMSGWRRSDGRRFTIRSLHMWAKNDNPAEYKRLLDDDIVNFIETHIDAKHTHIARLMQRMYWGTYRASVDSKKTDWFEYKDNVWRKLAQGIELRNKMSTEVAELVDRARQSTRRLIGSSDAVDKNFVDSRFKRLLKIEDSLYTAGFKDSVMKECVGLFYEDDFAQKMNSNPYLIGFANGVLNLREERMGADGNIEYYCNFREGKPEDYVTFQAGRWLPKQCDPIDYIEYDPSDPLQTEIDDFMTKVFPRADLRNYQWRKLASCLEGTNREQRYDTWIGVGGNGKSKLVDLMSMTLGDYATSLQSTVLTRKRPDSGAANPDIMAVRNRRFIYMAEPDDGEPLNTSRMKQFTGEDVVEARGLFEDQSKFQITGKMFMLCNKFPAIHAMDRGTWRRVMAVPFESKFVDPDGEEGKDIDPKNNIYPRDNHMDAKLKKWRGAFMARLVHVYETEYLRRGIEPIPAIVKQQSENYRALFDSFGKFKQARIRSAKGVEAVTIKDVWRVYKKWSEETGSGGGKRLTMVELQKRMEDEYGVQPDKKSYRRIQLFDSEEEIEEFDKGLADIKEGVEDGDSD